MFVSAVGSIFMYICINEQLFHCGKLERYFQIVSSCYTHKPSHTMFLYVVLILHRSVVHGRSATASFNCGTARLNSHRRTRFHVPCESTEWSLIHLVI